MTRRSLAVKRKRSEGLFRAEQGKSKGSEGKLRQRCFLCNGPYRARDFPTRSMDKVSVLRAEKSDSDRPIQTTILQVIGAMRVEQPKQGGLGFQLC